MAHGLVGSNVSGFPITLRKKFCVSMNRTDVCVMMRIGTPAVLHILQIAYKH